MAVLLGHFSHSPSLSCFRSPPHSKLARISCSLPSSSQMDTQNEEGRNRFMEFPYLVGPYKDLMVELASTMDSRLASYLRPCTLPPDVQYYHNDSRTAQASLHIQSGLKSSPIDFTLGNWLHCELPSGSLNIMSLSAYLAPSTDAPNFLLDIIQGSPTSLVFMLDLPPRKDLALHPDYLQTFYEDTQLDKHRQRLEKIPEVRPYISSSLYIRCFLSPTRILVRIETEVGKTERMEEIVRDHVSPIAKEVLGVWLDRCACGERTTEETDQAYLTKRDGIIKKKTIEIELGSSLPRLVGQEVADRVLVAIREVFNIA